VGIFVLLFFIALYISYRYYQKIYAAAVQVEANDPYLYLPTGTTFSQLVEQLKIEGIIQDTASFVWVAEQKKFDKPKAGKYKLSEGMSNNALINLLRSGKEETVNVTFNTIRSREQLAGSIGKQIEADSTALLAILNSEEWAGRFGFDHLHFFSMFIPNTYEFYWDTSAEEFVQKMATEYKRFWTEKRRQKAKELGLSQSEVAVLASIMQAEQNRHPDERPRVAGLYLNRLQKGIRLQSDPTLVYAWDDFSIRRVLDKHKAIESPYNTYKYAGLPPGPINLPEISSLNAVLNAEDHDYYYMCAKPDFSGYHNFSRTLSQHNQYAAAYRRELNKRKIMQ
jgi:UPF0755 protein